MKLIYRPHKGLLSQAMSEAKIFESLEDMKIHIVNYHDGYINIDDIVINIPDGDDNRIGWKNVQSICTKKYGSEDYIAKYGVVQCIGNMTYEWNIKKAEV